MAIKNILISQPFPISERSKCQYADIVNKYNVNIHFKKFFKVVRVSTREFRRSKINIQDYNALIFSSRHAIDFFFNLLEDLRLEVPAYIKYYFLKHEIATYVSKYTKFRKRKIFFPKNTDNPCEIFEYILMNKDDKFLVCGSNAPNPEITSFLDKNNIQYSKAIIYKNLSERLSDIQIQNFDLIGIFSPNGAKAYAKNFPNYLNDPNLKKIKFIAFGNNTAQTLKELNIPIEIIAPNETISTMPQAIEEIIKKKRK